MDQNHSPDAAVQPGHVRRPVHRPPALFSLSQGGPDLRLRAGAVQLQHSGRPLRGPPGGRGETGRDAFPSRRFRHLRPLRRTSLQQGNAGRPVQGGGRSPISLAMTVDEKEALKALKPSALKRRLATLRQVGPGYIQPGQPAPDANRGEAQRIGLTRFRAGGRIPAERCTFWTSRRPDPTTSASLEIPSSLSGWATPWSSSSTTLKDPVLRLRHRPGPEGGGRRARRRGRIPRGHAAADTPTAAFLRSALSAPGRTGTN